MINFQNGVANPKDENLAVGDLPTKELVGKLMIKKGLKVSSVRGLDDFIQSNSGKCIRAELFSIEDGILVPHPEYFLNITKKNIKAKKSLYGFFVEMIPEKFNVAEMETVTF